MSDDDEPCAFTTCAPITSVVTLTDEQYDRVLELIENPPPPSPALIALMRGYKEGKPMSESQLSDLDRKVLYARDILKAIVGNVTPRLVTKPMCSNGEMSNFWEACFESKDGKVLTPVVCRFGLLGAIDAACADVLSDARTRLDLRGAEVAQAVERCAALAKLLPAASGST